MIAWSLSFHLVDLSSTHNRAHLDRIPSLKLSFCICISLIYLVSVSLEKEAAMRFMIYVIHEHEFMGVMWGQKQTTNCCLRS